MTISSQQQELVDLLRNELAEIIAGDYSLLSDANTSARTQFLEEVEVQAENIGNAARLVGLAGAAAACEWLMQNFQLLAVQAEPVSEPVQKLVQSWGVLLLGYLQYVGDDVNAARAVDNLLHFLGDPAWPQPLADEHVARVAEQFQLSAVLPDEPAVLYPAQVTEEMVSLSPGSDINPELLRGLLAELPNQVSAFDRAVEQFLITEEDVQLRIAQRIAHTLKGAANVVGIQGIANLTHYLEDLLELSTKHKRTVPRLGFLLQDAADCLSNISEFLIGIAPRPTNVRSVMESVLEMLRGLESNGLDLEGIAAAGPGQGSQAAAAAPAFNNVVRFAPRQEREVVQPVLSAPVDIAEAELFEQMLAQHDHSHNGSAEDGNFVEIELLPRDGTPEQYFSPVAAAETGPDATTDVTATDVTATEFTATEFTATGFTATGTAATDEIPVLEDIYHRPSRLVEEPPADVVEESTPVTPAPLIREAAAVYTATPHVASPAAAAATAAKAPIPGLIANPPAEVQETVDTTLNISEAQAQELLRLSGESQIGNTQILSRLDLVANGIHAAEAYHAQLRQMAQDLERLLELQTAMAAATGNVREQDMDPLELERYNELNSFASQLHEVTTDAHEAFVDLEDELKSLKNLVINQRQLGFESQELLLNIRMLPVSVFGSRFSRCVRQAARFTNKPAAFELKGEDVLVDSRVLTTLVDPIMHLLRNAVDHGLEASEQERAALGKPPTGQVVLEFVRAGDTVMIHCRDDGRGLDYEAIARAAVERGLVPADVRLTVADLNALILSPGFSTRREITQTSGRGVGLDVVNEQIRLLKGTLSITSQRGRGTTFTLVAPMSILSAHTLVVQVGEHRVSVISRALEQVMYVEQERLEKREGRQWYRLPMEDEVLPVFRMDDLLFLNTRAAERYTALIVLRNREGKRCGVLAETIKASEEQIIKPLSRTTYKVAGVVGATILGDGRVSPVVDLYELPGLTLADASQATWRRRFEKRLSHLHNEVIKERPMALVVDDSLSARRSLAQFVGDMGMEVYTAKDGFEAIQIIEQRMPSVILVDLEMPRMNGLELTSHLRANEETKDIPIIMITSRATEKHRSMAERVGVNTYLNKPWTDDELLSSIQSQIA